MTAPQIDLGVPDSVLIWYDSWPTLLKFLFWICGGVVIFLLVAAVFGVRNKINPGHPDAVSQIEKQYQQYIKDLEKDVERITKKKQAIEKKRTENKEERDRNETKRRKAQDGIDAGSVDDIDDLYERNRRRG